MSDGIEDRFGGLHRASIRRGRPRLKRGALSSGTKP
jgi:hypothetical protein